MAAIKYSINEMQMNRKYISDVFSDMEEKTSGSREKGQDRAGRKQCKTADISKIQAQNKERK